jgi:pre-mRNA-splicing factor ATP-dependent RNA helicase DHX16
VQVLTIVSMLSESGSLFYRPKQKKLEGALLFLSSYPSPRLILTTLSRISLSLSLFIPPFTADTARQNFIKPGGDHFMLLNVWEQWQESGFSISWTYEHFIQIKVRLFFPVYLSFVSLTSFFPHFSTSRLDPSLRLYQSLTRVRDIRDQLVQLCERVEIFVEGNPNSSDIIPVQKAICAGYFQNTGRLNRSGDAYRTIKCVSFFRLYVPFVVLTSSPVSLRLLRAGATKPSTSTPPPRCSNTLPLPNSSAGSNSS